MQRKPITFDHAMVALSEMLERPRRLSLSDALNTFVQRHPFYGAFLLALDHVEHETLPSPCQASTRNGRLVLLWRPEMFERLLPTEALALLQREALHVILNHDQRSAGREPHSWAAAADCMAGEMVPRGLTR